MCTVRAPEEITKPKHQNTHARQLHHSREITIKRLHEVRKHGRESEGPETLDKRHGGGEGNGAELPVSIPVLHTPHMSDRPSRRDAGWSEHIQEDHADRPTAAAQAHPRRTLRTP